MAWDAGTITSAAPWAAFSTKLKNMVGGTGVENWSFVENVPAGTGVGQSGSASYSLDVFRCRGAANLYKRAYQVNLGNTHNTTDSTSFTFTVTAPSTNQFITCFIANTKATAADDPTTVSLNGSNPPTFTKIKSQASGGGTPLMKGTLWIGKTGASTPTGTTLTVTFSATQTSCLIILDQWDGCDVTLLADNVDPTAAAQIGIQVVGNNGTTQTAHSATLAAMFGARSVAVTWAAETASTGTYTAEAGWAPVAASVTNAGTPACGARGMFRTDQDDLTGVLTLSSATSETDWTCIALEFQRTTQSTSVTSPNDAAQDWYWIMEIPVTDGAVTSVFNCAEDYDGNRLFRGMPPSQSTAIPVGPTYRRSDTLTQYASVTGNNRGSLLHQALNTTGFSYWIKLTNNSVVMATRVSAAEQSNGAMLLDSFVTNVATDLPLIQFASSASAGASFSRLPGIVTTLSGTGWTCAFNGWTGPVISNVTSNAASAQDLWAGSLGSITGKVHAARVYTVHVAGNSAANCLTMGQFRGLWKTDYLCIAAGGTIQLGDSMPIGTSVLTSGSLVTGKTYKIITYVAGDDFVNVGGTNSSGTVFTATGTTPTTWSNGSSLQELNYFVIAKGTLGGTGTLNAVYVTKNI